MSTRLPGNAATGIGASAVAWDKLKNAFATGVHHTIGRDLVNHCVNDILVQGARPLFFLDYIATGKLAPETVASIVAGIANGCTENGAVLLGGETAEMPGFYADGEYDVAGFIVGVVDREQVIDGHAIKPGDLVLGLPSVGLHTNGYSLARKLFFEAAGYTPDSYLTKLGESVGAALLKPHLSYLRPLAGLLTSGTIKGLAHITGGGLLGNIPAHIPEGTACKSSAIPGRCWPIFETMQHLGKVEMLICLALSTWNRMVVVCAESMQPGSKLISTRAAKPVSKSGVLRAEKSA